MSEKNTSSNIIFTLFVVYLAVSLANIGFSIFFIDFPNPGVQLFYSIEDLEYFFSNMAVQWKDPFLFLLLLDYLFLAASALLYSNYIRFSFWKLVKSENLVGKIALVPYGYAALDFLENTLFVLLTVAREPRLPWETLATVVSILKWISLALSLILCGIGAIIWFLHRISKKLGESS